MEKKQSYLPIEKANKARNLQERSCLSVWLLDRNCSFLQQPNSLIETRTSIDVKGLDIDLWEIPKQNITLSLSASQDMGGGTTDLNEDTAGVYLPLRNDDGIVNDSGDCQLKQLGYKQELSRTLSCVYPFLDHLLID
jgi:hypothetical protein